MAVDDHELKLGTQIALWQSPKQGDDPLEFILRRGHIQMRMSGLVWSIEALPLPDTMDYTFNIIEVKRSESPFDLCKAMAADLPAKFKLLVVALQIYIRSVFQLEELLNKLYACSRLLFQAENDKQWWIVVDAEIMAVACKTAREATQEAAKAAAVLLAELMEPLACFLKQNIIIDEVWAMSFSATEKWNAIKRAVDGGDVLQWCKVRVLESDKMIHCFEFEVAVQDFLQGNDEISRIGVVNSRVLKVTVDLEGDISVACSQEGVGTETSSGLDSLLPHLIRNYITTAPERNEGELGINNIVQRLLHHVVGYLTFFPRVCVFCGSHRFLDASLTTTCSYLCEVRKNIWGDSFIPLTWASGDQRRRISLSNTEAAEPGLSTLLLTDDDDDDRNENAEDVVN